MPRLTNRDYLTIRHFLVRLRKQDHGDSFEVLPGYAQRELHDFYAPTVFMTDEDAVAHRAAMTKAFPALPQSAGRAFEALRASLEDRPNHMVDRHLESATGTFTVGRTPRQMRLLGLSRPQIDPFYLARAFVRLSKEDVDGKLLKKALKAKERNERKRH